MSTPAPASASPAPTAPAAASGSPPPPSTASPSVARHAPEKQKQAAPARKRKPLRRRGARADDEDESEVARAPPPPAAAADAASDSDSDFAPSPDSDSDDDDDDDDDDERDGATAPHTPADQFPQRGANGGGTKPVKAVLAGVVVHPSWSDAVDAAEEGDESVALPTLDFADLSLEAVQALPTAAAAAAGAKPLSKKQLALQRRETKSAALKARDPAEWEKREREHQEREEAKRAAKKERQKEKRRERKAAEKAGAPSAASTSAPAPVTVLSAPAPAPAARPAKPTRPVVPSRPSRTGLALGLVNPAAASSSSQPAHAAPAASTSTAPVVPAAKQQPAFLPRDAQGRSVPQPFATRGRGRGRGGVTVTGRWGAPASADELEKPASAATPAEWGHSGFDELEGERSARGGARGRGRGAALAGRGGALLQSGINPRFAHLPFHPSHRFHPAAQPKATAAGAAQAIAPEPVAPEATTAAPDDELFRDAGAPAKDIVKLPDGGAAQVLLAVKGAAARAAGQDRLAEKENAPPLHQQAQLETVDADAELRRQQGANILYAADPTRVANGAPLPEPAPYEQHQLPGASVPPAPFPQQVSDASAFMHHVPPHLQQTPVAVQASYIPRHSSPAYYAPPPHAYYPDPTAMAPSPGATPTPPPPFGAVAHAPAAAYFLPPRPNKRVEIKAPSRDGQSPVPLKSAGPAPPNAFEAAQQARIAQLVREAEERQHHYAQVQAHSDAATAGSSSPASTRATFLPDPPVAQQLPFAPAPYYPGTGSGGAAPPPASAPMFSTYTHSSHGSFDGAAGAAPYPPASEQYAPYPQNHPHPHHLHAAHPLAQQQAFYPSHPHHPHAAAAQLQHPYQQLYDPYAAMQAQYYSAPPPPPQSVDGQRWAPY
ncbi:hypothetical protein JCM3770_001851 [Rhodotorula araucariae]